MCKVMMIAGIKQKHIPKVYQLTKAMAKAMSYVEDDGVGYAAITKDGKLYGEKWLDKDQAFVVHGNKIDDIVEFIDKQFKDTIEYDKPPQRGGGYEAFGEKTKENVDNTVAVVLHSRKATVGGKALCNVHPFVFPGDNDHPATALIHNGGILNHDKLTKVYSTCDSEVILHEYLANQMYHNPWGVEQVAKTLVGSYTVGVLGSQYEPKTKLWTPYLDIFKSNKDLYGAYIPEIETMMFSTSNHQIETVVKDVGMAVKHLFKLKDGYLHRLNAITGLADMEAASFSTSPQYLHGGHNKAHHNSARHRNGDGVYPYGPNQASAYDDGVSTFAESVESVKSKFERNHPELFQKPYLEGDITDKEKEFFAELEKDKKTDLKALRLVSEALNFERRA